MYYWRFAFTGLVFSSSVFAQPQGPSIVSGEAAFAIHSPLVMEIVASNRAVLEWQDFSNSPGEITRFIQPNSHSSVLNRVLSANPSRLMGSLESNGQVLLINPNGVLVGKNGMIDCGSFIASTLDVHQQTFLENGELVFSGNSRSPIVNFGSIKTTNGDAILIGYLVHDAGSIEVNNGTAALLAGSDILVKPNGFDRIHVKMVEFPKTSDDNVFSSAFLHDLTPDATEFIEEQGEFHLSELHSQAVLHGTISSQTSEGKGGDAIVSGEQIWIKNGSRIDVSGASGGGNIWIGGEAHGKESFLKNALFLFNEPETTLTADALEQGDGGQIVLWGNLANNYYGQAFAQGGPLSGNGGFVEVSSPQSLVFDGSASTLAPLGKTGKLLLDPINILVVPGLSAPPGPSPCPALPACLCPLPVLGGTCQDFTSGAGFSIGSTNIQNALATNDVVLDSTGGGGGSGNITFSGGANVTWAHPTNLVLLAPATGTIIINSIVQNNGTGANIGNAIIEGGGTITVTPVIGSLTATFGSLNGLTSICTTGNVNILGIGTAVSFSQIGGLMTAATAGANGTICVTCANLNLTGGSATPCAVQLGHGFLEGLGAALIPSQSAAGSITVNCSNLTLTGGGDTTGNGSNFSAHVGHLYSVRSGAAPTSGSGPIVINCTNTVSLFGGTDNGAAAAIGHAYGNYNQAAAPVVFGSSTGDITVNATNVFLLSGTYNPAIVGVAYMALAQIGHNSLTNFNSRAIDVTNSGNITVNATQNINLIGGGIPSGVHRVNPAQIGHGSIGEEIDSTQLSNSSGTITVNAGNNITLTGGGSQASYAKIGHGDNCLDVTPLVGATPAGNYSGDIIVNAIGTITLNASSIFASAHIGHGLEEFITGTINPPLPGVTYSGNINVSARSTITLNSTSGTGASGAIIGHGSMGSVLGFSVASLTMTGDINVVSQSTLSLVGGIHSSLSMIGHIGTSLFQPGAVNVPQFITSNVIASANAISMTTQGDNVFIGCQQYRTPDIVTYVSGSTVALSRTTINLATTTPAGGALRLCSIGADYDARGANPINVYVAACGNITLTNVAGAPSVQVAIQGRDNVFVSSGGDITLKNQNNTAQTSIGSYGNPGTLTQIYAAGSVIGSQTTFAPHLSYFGSGWNTVNALASGSSLTVRAGGDVIIPSSFPIIPTPAAGNIFIEADTQFAGGDLWTVTSPFPGPLTMIGNQLLPAPVPATDLFGCMITSSSPVLPNHVGGVFFNTGPGVAGPTFSALGQIKVDSSSTGVPANGFGIADLELTPNPLSSNTHQLKIGTFGSLCISGVGTACGPANAQNICQGDNIFGFSESFRDVTINESLTATFNPSIPAAINGIFISAERNVTDNQPLNTVASNGFIVLVSDYNEDKIGDLKLNSSITTGGGLIFLEAGSYNVGGLSSIFLNDPNGVITSATGNVIFSAADSINLSPTILPLLNSISTGGLIDMIAGNSINFNSTNISGVAVSLISGVNVNLLGSSTINSQSYAVIVVDNNNCCPLVLGTCKISNTPGILNMAPTASITAPSTLRIYTAYQGSSNILGLLNGVLFGPGTSFPYEPLFASSTYEQWCSCCACTGCRKDCPLNAQGVPVCTTNCQLTPASNLFFLNENICSVSMLGGGCTPSIPGCPFMGGCTPPTLGCAFPFMIFYKNCLPPIVQQAQIVINEYLYPLYEFPGWWERFDITYRPGTTRSSISSSLTALPVEGYYLRRKLLKLNNQPKSYTTEINGTFDPKGFVY